MSLGMLLIQLSIARKEDPVDNSVYNRGITRVYFCGKPVENEEVVKFGIAKI